VQSLYGKSTWSPAIGRPVIACEKGLPVTCRVGLGRLADGVGAAEWTAPVILEALILGEDGSHASTAEVPRGASACIVAHTEGLVHRDIKPGNLLVAPVASN